MLHHFARSSRLPYLALALVSLLPAGSAQANTVGYVTSVQDFRLGGILINVTEAIDVPGNLVIDFPMDASGATVEGEAQLQAVDLTIDFEGVLGSPVPAATLTGRSEVRFKGPSPGAFSNGVFELDAAMAGEIGMIDATCVGACIALGTAFPQPLVVREFTITPTADGFEGFFDATIGTGVIFVQTTFSGTRVPEPGAAALLGGGWLVLIGLRVRREWRVFDDSE